jgi:hypothetical protein
MRPTRTKLAKAIAAIESSRRILRAAGVASRSRKGLWKVTALGRKAMAQVDVEESYARTPASRRSR